MKDIDFDELDRAVHSATNGSKGTQDDSRTAVEEAVKVTTPAAPSPVRPPVSLATRRSSGRFMDVVHPSSDMRNKVNEAIVSTDNDKVVVQKDVPMKRSQSVAETKEESWPDPIDFQKENTVDQDDDASSDTPLESPFLAGAKVEKRPLGAFSGDAPTEEDPQDVVEDVSDIFEEQQETPEVESTEKRDGVVEEEELLLLPESTQDEEKVVVDEQPVGPVSITQQYSEQSSTAEPSTTMIFDTDEYKKPLTRPKKKGSGWLVILWIIILLAVGAGAGAAIYFYVLPLL